jgi:hypothetical protein
VIAQIDPREIDAAFQKAGAEIAKKTISGWNLIQYPEYGLNKKV